MRMTNQNSIWRKDKQGPDLLKKNVGPKKDDYSENLILPAALGPGVYSASNRNEYQELIKNNFPGE
jgi:hypothetical protein